MDTITPAKPILSPRQHIQDHNTAQSEKHYWGYPSRVVPCANDKGSCEYLDSVYWMHTVSMLYTFILWAVIGGIMLIFILSRLFRPHRKATIPGQDTYQSLPYRTWRSLVSESRRHLLPESLSRFFPYTTRLQILFLVTLCIYLMIFSWVRLLHSLIVADEIDLLALYTRLGERQLRIAVNTILELE